MVFTQPLAAVGEKENVREDILLYLGSLFSIANSLAVETVVTPIKPEPKRSANLNVALKGTSS